MTEYQVGSKIKVTYTGEIIGDGLFKQFRLDSGLTWGTSVLRYGEVEAILPRLEDLKPNTIVDIDFPGFDRPFRRTILTGHRCVGFDGQIFLLSCYTGMKFSVLWEPYD